MISDRNVAIIEARLSGKTLRQVGDMFDIGPERVRQVTGYFVRKLRNYDKMRNKLWNLQRDLEAARRALIDTNIKYKKGADILVKDLELSVRAANGLRFYKTVGVVAAASDSELLRIPNFGRKSLREVREIVGCEQGETE